MCQKASALLAPPIFQHNKHVNGGSSDHLAVPTAYIDQFSRGKSCSESKIIINIVELRLRNGTSCISMAISNSSNDHVDSIIETNHISTNDMEIAQACFSGFIRSQKSTGPNFFPIRWLSVIPDRRWASELMPISTISQ